MELLQSILLAAVVAGTGLLVEWVRRRLGIEGMRRIEMELHLRQDLAVIAVKYAEQAYRNLRGPDKYVHASEWLSKALEARGLRVSPEDLRALIEWALREIRDEFGDQWGKAARSEQGLS